MKKSLGELKALERALEISPIDFIPNFKKEKKIKDMSQNEALKAFNEIINLRIPKSRTPLKALSQAS